MKSIALAVIFLFILGNNVAAENWKQIIDLRGQWKFQLDDNQKWSEPVINDSKWDEIYVPSSWEDEGYPGYDGYAWYRKHCTIPASAKSKALYLNIGNTDDVSEVFINGHFIGFVGSFPPDYSTAYAQSMRYFILPDYINYGTDNVIAVRVYDSQMGGGIVQGKIGIYERQNLIVPDVPLPVRWKFRTGDDREWRDPSFDDSHWKEIDVPAFWETQGYKDYDGIGWYRVRFKIPQKLLNEDLVLMLGKIDDLDETFLNGKKIGKTGSIPSNLHRSIVTEYQKNRAYSLPQNILNEKGDNVLAVRVFDNYMHGGIYDGPIGITTRRKYEQWAGRYNEDEENNRTNWKQLRNGLEEFLDDIFK